MTIKLDLLLLLGLASSALHWLIARSEIAKPLWSRAGGVLGALLRCPACSGFWIGLGLAAGGLTPLVTGSVIANILATGILALYLTPVFEAVLLWGLGVSAIEEPPTQD
jgi:hypothetical protein